MTELRELLAWPALFAGVWFFVIAAVGLLRLPNLFSRLHAVACADSVGFALLTLGLVLRADSVEAGAVLVLVCLLSMATGAVDRQLLARYGEKDHPHMGAHSVRERS